MGKAQNNPFYQEMEDPTRTPWSQSRAPPSSPFPGVRPRTHPLLLPPRTCSRGGHVAAAGGSGSPEIGKMSWGEMWKATKEFFTHPMNIAITVWMILTTPACVIIGLELTSDTSQPYPRREGRRQVGRDFHPARERPLRPGMHRHVAAALPPDSAPGAMVPLRQNRTAPVLLQERGPETSRPGRTCPSLSSLGTSPSSPTWPSPQSSGCSLSATVPCGSSTPRSPQPGLRPPSPSATSSSAPSPRTTTS